MSYILSLSRSGTARATRDQWIAELLLACVLAVFFFFNVFLCICVLVLYLLVVRAAGIDGCLCLSGSLPLLSCMLVLIVF